MKRKLFSVILAVIMVTASFTAAIPAFAADTAADVKAKIDAFEGDMTEAEPSASVLESYNSIIAAFNALSQEERDAFDVYSFDKLLLAVYDREYTAARAADSKLTSINAYKLAAKNSEEILKMPAYVAEAKELNTQANAIKTDANVSAFLDRFAAADLNAVILAGGYYSFYTSFRYSVSDKYGAELLDIAADKIMAVTQKTDSASKPSSPKYVSKPSASKFPGGESDPDYIAAYKAYIAYKEANADYNVAKYEWDAKHYLPAIKSLTEKQPSFEFVYSLVSSSVEAKKAYNESGATDKITEAARIYNGLTDVQKLWIKTFDNNIFGEKTIDSVSDLGTEYGYKYYTTDALADYCKSMEFYYTVNDFENTVNSVEEPYTNDDIAVVKAAYDSIPTALRSAVNADVQKKYKDILASVGPDASEDNNPDLSAFNPTKVSFKYLSVSDAEMLADEVVKLVLKAAGVSDTAALINTKVLTNGMINTLAGFLYPLLSEKTNGLINVTPASLAKKLTEEKFAGAVAALTAAGDDWSAAVINNKDFGFEDGDEEGFLDAAAAMLRGASLIHFALKLENQTNTANGTYTYGAYEDFIKLFEILDLRAVMSSVDYTKYVNEAEKKDDAKFRALLAPIVYLIKDFANDPVNTVCNILPKVAYALDQNIVTDSINNVIAKISLISIAPVDLSANAVYNILNDKVLAPNDISLSADEFSTLITALKGCGKAVVKPSVEKGVKYRMGIEADRASSVVVIMNWALDIAQNNQELVDTLIDKLAGDNAVLNYGLKLLVSSAVKYVPRKVIFIIAKVFIRIAAVFDVVKSLFTK